jgi:hypothetical protein
LGMYIAE